MSLPLRARCGCNWQSEGKPRFTQGDIAQYTLPLNPKKWRLLQSIVMRRLLGCSPGMLKVGAPPFLLALPLANAPKESPPDVPDSIQTPARQQVVLFAHATRPPLSSCQPAADRKFT